MAAAAMHSHSSQADSLAFVNASLSLIESIHALQQPLRTACDRAQVNKQQCNTMLERVEAMMPLLGEIEGELQQGIQSRDSLDSTQSERPLMNNQRQLEFMLAAVEDALALVSKFSSAATLRRLWERSDYSDDFASINEMLLEAQFDLCFGLEKTGLFNPQRDARDAKADLAHISRSIDQIVQCVEDGVPIAGAVDAMESVSSSLPNPATLPSVFPAVRFDSGMAKQQAIDKWQQRVAAEIRSIDHQRSAPRVVAASASASSSSASAASPLRAVTSDLLHIPLSDLTLDPRPVGYGGYGDVYRALWIPHDCIVAVKRLRVAGMTDPMLEDFYSELTVLHGLPRHAHIVGLLGAVVDEPSRTYLMVMGQLSANTRTLRSTSAAANDVTERLTRACGLTSTAEEGAASQTVLRADHCRSSLTACCFVLCALLLCAEWMEQGSLYDYLRLHRRSPDGGSSFPLLSRLQMCLQCAAAVNHLHLLRPPKGPVVHRDIKSPNILIDKFGEIKLADFGLAKVRAASTIVSSAAHIQKQAVGTLPWMAPEHLRPGGKKSSTPASDIYALAVVFWEIITLSVPYDGDDDETIKDSIKGGPDNKLTIPDSVPPKLRSLLQRCWLNDPKQRPSCSDLIRALKSLIAGEERFQLSCSSFVAPAVVTAAAAAPYSPAHSALGSSEIADFDRMQALCEQVTNMQTGESAAQQSVEAPSAHLTEVLPAVGFSHARHQLSAGFEWIATEERNLSSESTAVPPATGIAASSAAPLHPRTQPSARESVDSAPMMQLRDGVSVQQAEAEANGRDKRESNWSIRASFMQPQPPAPLTPIAAPVVASSSMHPASRASAIRPSEGRSVSDAFSRVSSLRVRCLFVTDEEHRTLRVSGAEVFAAKRGSQVIDVFPVASADHPNAVPIRRIDVGLLVTDFALQPDGQRLFVTAQATTDLFSHVRLVSFDSRTGRQLRSVMLKKYVDTIAIAVNAMRVFCVSSDGLIEVFSVVDLKPLGRVEQDPEWADLIWTEQEDPPAAWIQSASAICCFEDRVFVADHFNQRVSVWNATTLKHLFNFGRTRTQEERAATACGQAPPACTFWRIHSMCLYRHDAASPPVLVISDSGPHLLVYSLHGDRCTYIGAMHLPDSRVAFSLSSDALGSDLWVASSRSGSPPLSDFALKQFRSSLKAGDSPFAGAGASVPPGPPALHFGFGLGQPAAVVAASIPAVAPVVHAAPVPVPASAPVPAPGMPGARPAHDQASASASARNRNRNI